MLCFSELIEDVTRLKDGNKPPSGNALDEMHHAGTYKRKLFGPLLGGLSTLD
jgi:hypothetical protein